MAIKPPAHADSEKSSIGDRRDLSKLFGLLKWQGPPLTVEDMQAAIEAAVVARYRHAVGMNTPPDDEA